MSNGNDFDYYAISWYTYTFHYVPSESLAIVAIIAFSLATVLVTFGTIKYGGRFMWIIVSMGIAEVIGYGLRIFASNKQDLTAFIVSTLCLLMAPIALALINYVVVARLVKEADMDVRIPKLGWKLTPNRISKFFFIGDLLCFILQAAGGGLLAVGVEQLTDIGTVIVLFGLAIQLFFFTSFVWVIFAITRKNSPLMKIDSLKLVFHGLAFTISMLYIRNIFRVIEFATGMESYVNKNEWTFYMFETFPIFLAFLAYAYWHFGRLLECKALSPLWVQQLQDLKANHIEID